MRLRNPIVWPGVGYALIRIAISIARDENLSGDAERFANEGIKSPCSGLPDKTLTIHLRKWTLQRGAQCPMLKILLNVLGCLKNVPNGRRIPFLASIIERWRPTIDR